MLPAMLVVAATLASPEAPRSSPQSTGAIGSDCSFRGQKLWGKVQIVEHFPDFKVKKVDHFPDLNVALVEHFPDACGKWQIVEHFADFKVQFVESFPDFEIRIVDHFPGLP